MNEPAVAVLIPCFNESRTVGKVVADFKKELPQASIYVFDNNSTDETAVIARNAGAIVIREIKQGKGFVVAAMLSKVSADYYVMVDGDDTYAADCVKELLKPVLEGHADMVVGQRLAAHTTAAFRPLHIFGNRLVVGLINTIFSSKLTDVMSGYRAFTRGVAVSLPIVASGFDVETEMTLQLLYRGYVIKEVPVPYKERPAGSTSKLSTISDGAIVLLKIMGIFKAYKPLTFFGGLGFISLLAGTAPHLRVALGLLDPSRQLSLFDVIGSSVSILSFLTLSVAGVIVHTLNFRILEMTSILIKTSQHVETGIVTANEDAAQGYKIHAK